MKKVSVLSFVLLFSLITYCCERLEFVPDPMEFDDFFSREGDTAVSTSNVAFSIDLTPDPTADSSSHERTEANLRECSICNKMITESRFKRHIGAHKAKKTSVSYHCQAGCTFMASSREDLAAHHKNKHNKGRRLKYEGTWMVLSNYYKAKKGGQRKGVRRRRSLKRCRVCSWCFLPGKHEHTHTGEEILCDLCPYKMDSHQAMQRHREEDHHINTTHHCKCNKCKGKFLGRSTFFKHKRLKKRSR